MVGLDYGIIALYLALLIWLGSSFASRQTTASEYFLISRTVPWWAVCFTVVATETSTLTFIGIPAQTYAAGGNLTFLQLALGYLAGRFIISALFIPKYFAKQLLTSYEVLHDRFGAPVRNLGSAMFLVTRSAADGIRLFATSAVIATLVGVPIWVAIVVLGVAMIVYTFFGGAAAVIWTDVIQMFVYLAGAGIILWFALAGIPGGIAEVLTFGENTGRWTMFDLEWNFFRAYTFWAGVIGGVTLTLATHGTDQFLVQRLLTARSEREAQAGLSLSGVLVFLQFGLFLFIGVALAAFYQYLPAPDLTRGDMLIPTFVRDHVPAGLAGFVVAAIVAAALSPSINSLAATTVNDFYLKYWRPDADDAAMLRVAHRATIAWGLVQIGVALLATQLTQSVLDAGLAVLGLGAGPVLGAFLLATLRRRFDPWHVAGAMLVAWVVVFSTYWFSPVAWPWYSTIGAGITVTIALLPLRRVATAGLAVLVVSTAACGDAPATEAPVVSEGIEVAVADARLAILRDVINANGEITPAAEADWTVHASETAQIVDLPFAEGETVEAGDVVVRFEVASRTAAIQSTEFDLSRDVNRLETARLKVQELTALFAQGLTARVELDAAKSEMAAADALVSAGRSSLQALTAAQARDVVRARFGGVILKQYHYRGDVVTAGGQDPVLRIVDPTQREVTVLVPVTEAGRLMIGQRLSVTPLGFAPFATMVRAIMPASGIDDTMVRVRASLPAPVAGAPPAVATEVTAADVNTDEDPAPAGPPVGTPVLGEILVAEVAEALVIPPQAILRASGTPHVMVVDQDGRAARRDIRLGVVTSQLAQVVDGLQAGEIVITSALTELTEGDRVRYSR